jgi:cytolysin (calcineurin-like family phosphatase)
MIRTRSPVSTLCSLLLVACVAAPVLGRVTEAPAAFPERTAADDPAPEEGDDPEKPDDDAPEAKPGTIKGKVTVKGRAVQGGLRAEVSLAGTAHKTQASATGTYRFDDVPAGKYTVEVKGIFSNKRITGTVEDVEPDPEKKQSVDVDAG